MVEAYKVVKKGVGKDEKAPVEDRLKYLEASAEVGRIRQSWPDIPMIYAVRDSTPANARVMVKGDPKTLGPEVPRGFLQILGGQTYRRITKAADANCWRSGSRIRRIRSPHE